MANIELDDLISYLGKPTKREGTQVYWRCPYCEEEGRDRHEDNLIYSTEKKIVKCFADESHSPQLLSDIYSGSASVNKNYHHQPTENPKPENPLLSEEQKQANWVYMQKCHNYLLKDAFSLDLIRKNRGIEKETIEICRVGYDTKDDLWVFPTFKFSTDGKAEIVGFEFRPWDLSKVGLHRDKGSQTCMAMINEYTPEKCCLAILEGYLDAYAFAQNLSEQGQLKYYHIATPSNGVTGIVNRIKEIDYCFNNYKRIYVYLDSDEVSKPQMYKIKEQYPFVEIKIMSCGCKDFNEHYLKCIKGNKIIE